MDINKLTLGEIAAVENLAGVGMGVLGDEEAPKGKLLAALVFVVKKRSNSEFTFEDAMNVDMETAMETLGLNEVADPKE